MTEREACQKFERACALLQEVARGTKFSIYLAGSTLNLMKGPSHDGEHRPLRQNVVESYAIPKSGGGDW